MPTAPSSPIRQQGCLRHVQLGGVAPTLATMIKAELGYKYHWAVPIICSAPPVISLSGTDVAQAYAMGKAALSWRWPARMR